MAVMGGAAVGLGGLCYYGLYGASGSADDVRNFSAVDRAVLWPDYVRRRIQSVYSYFAGGALVAGASAITLAQNPVFIRLMTSGGWLAPIGMLVASVGAGIACQVTLATCILVY